jgi:hypothetical protein
MHGQLKLQLRMVFPHSHKPPGGTQCTHQFAGVDRIDGDLWPGALQPAELQPSQEPHPNTYSIQDGCICEAQGKIHIVMSYASIAHYKLIRTWIVVLEGEEGC